MKPTLICLAILRVAFLCAQSAVEPVAERVYLQTDKQLYLAGERILLKTFTVTPDLKPITLSKIVYVELLDEKTAQSQVKIELTGGVGTGWIELPAGLTTGTYRLTAYTRFMRNESPSVFCEKNIGIINTFLPNQIKPQTPNPKSQPPSPIPPTPSPTPHLPITITLDQKIYTPRCEGTITIDRLPADLHTLSVVIAGTPIVAIPDHNPIRFWAQQIPPATTPSDQYAPEYEGHIVTGKIIPVQTSDKNTDDVLIPLLAFPGEKRYLFEGQTDDRNNVIFYTTNTSGVKEIATVVYNLSENIYRIDLLSPFVPQHAPKTLPTLPVDSAHFDRLLLRSVALQAQHAYTKDSIVRHHPADYRFYDAPSHTYILDEYTRFERMPELVTEFIRELRFRRNDLNQHELMMVATEGSYITWGRPLVVLDGIPIFDHETIYRYNPLLIERVNIYKGEHIYGNVKFDGVVEFVTYKHNYPSLSTDQATQVVNYAGTQPMVIPYTPNYADAKRRQSRLPDYRHTLLWHPTVITNGKPTIRLPFNTSDFTSDFTVTVEGLTLDGKVISSEAVFTVR